MSVISSLSTQNKGYNKLMEEKEKKTNYGSLGAIFASSALIIILCLLYASLI
jgi:hypothetical protein